MKKEFNYIDLFSLKNKKVLLLGGFGLIGYEATKAALDAEAEVLIVDIKYDKKRFLYLEKKYNKKKIKYLDQKNLSDEKIELYSKTYSIMVNCIYFKDKNWSNLDFNSISEKNFLNNIKDISYNSLWFPIVFARALKKNKKSGSIINLSSIYGLVAQDQNIYKNTNITENIVYNYNKSGLINFTKALASKYTKNGIRSNVVCPGGVINKSDKFQNSYFLKNYAKRVPISRLAKPSEIASVILFLASDSSSYLSGSTIVVDGGWLSI